VFLGFLLVDLLSDGLNWYTIVATVASLIALCLWERSQDAPFIDVRLLARKPSLSFVYIRGVATSYILYLILYGLPQWLEAVRHLIPVHTGLIMLPNSITAIGAGLLIARVKNSKLQNALGAGLFVVSCCGIFFLSGQIALPVVVGIGVVAGMAEGTNIIANQSLLNEEAPLDQKGVSFGLYRTAAYLGAILSGTQLKTIFRDGVTDHSFHRISFFIGVAVVILLLLLVPLLIRRKTPKPTV
jgi:MFS family permease